MAIQFYQGRCQVINSVLTLFINDMKEGVSRKLMKFTDDAKLVEAVNATKHREIMQEVKTVCGGGGKIC